MKILKSCTYYPRHRFHIKFVFLFEDSRGECLHRIPFHHRHGTLRDDWSTIKRLVNE